MVGSQWSLVFTLLCNASPACILDLTSRIHQNWWDVTSEIRLWRLWLLSCSQTHSCLLALVKPAAILWTALWRGPKKRQGTEGSLQPTGSTILRPSGQQPIGNWMVPRNTWMNLEWISLQLSLEWLQPWPVPWVQPVRDPQTEGLHRFLANKNYDNKCYCFKPLNSGMIILCGNI